MFFDTQKSRDKEELLLRRFLQTLEEIDIYLDKYDEFFGLAFNKDDPQGCLEKLNHFLTERFCELIESDEDEE